jgi:AraC family transcriptional regulator
MDVEIIGKPAFKIVGMKYQGKNEHEEVGQMWGRFIPRIKEIQHKVPLAGVYGAMDNLDEASGTFDYLAAVPVEQIADVPEGLVGWDIPEAEYAVVSCTLPTLMKAFDYMYKSWLPQSRYERACGAEFEFYDEDFNSDDENSAMSIYIPIKEKAGG